MKAVLIGSLLAGTVVLIVRIIRGRRTPDEPMLPEPDTDWID